MLPNHVNSLCCAVRVNFFLTCSSPPNILFFFSLPRILGILANIPNNWYQSLGSSGSYDQRRSKGVRIKKFDGTNFGYWRI
jgi:hypothetical protein